MELQFTSYQVTVPVRVMYDILICTILVASKSKLWLIITLI